MTKRSLLLLVLSLAPVGLFAQVTWENQVWTSVQLQKKLFSKTKAELTFESRYNTDPLMIVRYFPNLALQRKWGDHFTSVVHYRYITSNKGLGVRESSHRLMLDAITGGSVKKTAIAFRLRAGREDEPGVNEGIFSLSEFVFRQKLSVKHKFFKQEFSLAIEQFETIRGNAVAFDQRRYILGVEVKISKQHFLDFFVMYQDLIDVRRVNFGVGYVYEFKD